MSTIKKEVTFHFYVDGSHMLKTNCIYPNDKEKISHIFSFISKFSYRFEEDEEEKQTIVEDLKNMVNFENGKYEFRISSLSDYHVHIKDVN